MSKRIKDERDDTAGSSSFLSAIALQDLKQIRVYIGPRNRPSSNSSDLERDLDDPTQLRVHYRPGEGQRPIFSRDDIVVNAVKCDVEKKVVRKSSPHNSRTRRTRSCDSRSSRSYSRSPSRSSRKDSVPVKEYHRRSQSKELRDKVKDSNSEYLREQKKDVPGESDRYGSRRYSPVPGTSRHSNDDYRKDRHRRYESSPKRYEKNRSRSHSPRRSKFGTAEREKYIRGRSSPNSKKYSRSPHTKRSRSPYPRKRTPSPHFRRHIDSPHDRVHPSQGGYGRTVHYKKSSRSPPPRRYSRSPHKSSSSHKGKSRGSRSPYRKDKYYDRPRSRSPSGKNYHKYSSSSDRRRRSSSRSRNEQEQQQMMPDFGYYGPEGFWIPAPFGRPAFLPRGVLPPPMGMPRNMMRPGQPPYVIHRQYLPMQPIPMHHQFRPRYPIRYNNPNKVKISEISTTITTTTATATTSTSTATPQLEQSKPVVEEPPSDTDKT